MIKLNMIELINYKPYGAKEVFISKAMIQSMEKGHGMTSILMDGGVIYTVKETPEEILAMPDIEECNKTIDWEQRRYEIANGMLPIIYYDDMPQEGEDYLTLKQAANEAVRYAEALITELKKVNKQ